MLRAIADMFQREVNDWSGQVEVEVVRGKLAGKPVLRAYDKDRRMHMVFDSGRNAGQERWTEKVDRRWWNSVKQDTCGSK